MNNLPVMLLKGIVLLPYQDVKLDLSSDISAKVIDVAINKYDSNILVICPVNPYEEAPDISDLPNVGVIGKIINKLELPNSINIEIINQKPERIKKLTSEIIDVSTKNDEISLEEIIPNTSMKKDINKPYIIKDQEDIEDVNKKSKEEIKND